MEISLELYRVFVSVAQNKSFSAAAKELFITQPAVSQAIKQLEQALQSQLFVRTPRGVRLTQSGEMLLGYAENALGILATGQRRFEEMKSLQSGSLRIGGSDTLCRYYLLPYLSEFHRRYPGISVSVTNRTSQETVELLQTGAVDIGFVNLPLSVPSDVTVRQLVPIHDCFVYGKPYFSFFQNQTTITPAELSRCILLMLERQSATRRYLDDVLNGYGVQIQPQIELGSLDLLLDFAVAGLGVAAVPREYATELIQSGKLRALDLSVPIPPRHIGMIFHKRIPLSFTPRAFLDLLEQDGQKKEENAPPAP